MRARRLYLTSTHAPNSSDDPPKSKRLARYVEEFDTVELNASFYRRPRDVAFTGWRQRLPDGFTMAVKAHRGLTHFRRLKSPEPWVERFARCWEALLVQLHPATMRDSTTPRPVAAIGSGCDGAAAPDLERPGGVRAAGTARRRLCGDERGRAGLRSECDQRSGLHPDWADRVAAWQNEGRRVDVCFNNDLGPGCCVVC